MKDIYSIDAYNYDLPNGMIAIYPTEKRENSNLLVLNKKNGNIEPKQFFDIVNYFQSGDLLLLNNTKVFPARFYGQKRETDAKIELLVLDYSKENDLWTALSRPYKRLKENSIIDIGEDFYCEVIKLLGEGKVKIRFNDQNNFFRSAKKYGHIPLPPYLKRNDEESDILRYQTVYAKVKGAVAAPTAGLHFTDDLLARLKDKGVNISYITLHTGYGTFAPMDVDDIRDFKIHSEYFEIEPKIINNIRKTKENGGQIFSVGTTTTRAIEYAVKNKRIRSKGMCDLYIYPGYKFKVVDHLITNFHLPRTSLLVLVSAFAGYDNIIRSYKYAIENDFRFYSYGDAMLII